MMTKRMISFTPRSYKKLVSKALRRGVSVSEEVRLAVDKHLGLVSDTMSVADLKKASAR